MEEVLVALGANVLRIQAHQVKTRKKMWYARNVESETKWKPRSGHCGCLESGNGDGEIGDFDTMGEEMHGENVNLATRKAFLAKGFWVG